MFKIFTLAVSIVAISGCSQVDIVENKTKKTGSITFSKNVFSPKAGVICDTKSKFCSDSNGISLGFTKEYLGEEASNIWLKRLTDDFDTTVYTLSDGIFCDTNQKFCNKSKWDEKPDALITKRVFEE